MTRLGVRTRKRLSAGRGLPIPSAEAPIAVLKAGDEGSLRQRKGELQCAFSDPYAAIDAGGAGGGC